MRNIKLRNIEESEKTHEPVRITQGRQMSVNSGWGILFLRQVGYQQGRPAQVVKLTSLEMATQIEIQRTDKKVSMPFYRWGWKKTEDLPFIKKEATVKFR